MNKEIIKIIQEELKEIFDNLNNPPQYTIEKDGDSIIYRFFNENEEYGVIFQPFKVVPKLFVKDTNIKNKIENYENKYYVDFGIYLNNKLDVNSDTSKFDAVNIISFVFSIIQEFIKNNNVNVLAYFVHDKKRDNIYDYIYHKTLESGFDKYFTEHNNKKRVFFIKK